MSNMKVFFHLLMFAILLIATWWFGLIGFGAAAVLWFGLARDPNWDAPRKPGAMDMAKLSGRGS